MGQTKVYVGNGALEQKGEIGMPKSNRREVAREAERQIAERMAFDAKPASLRGLSRRELEADTIEVQVAH